MDNVCIEKKLCLIENFNDYFNLLNQNLDNKIVIIAIKASIGRFFLRDNMDVLNVLGIKEDLMGRVWSSFIGVIFNKKVVYEKCSNDELITYTDKIDGANIFIWSDISKTRNSARIEIDGVDYAVNNRGFNVVVFDIKNNKLIDSVTFDMDIESQLTYRIGSNLYLRGEIAKLKSQLTGIELNQQRQVKILQGMLQSMHNDMKDYNLRFFHSMPKADGNSRKIQLVGLAILKKIDKICRENKINYWMNFGTLLGAFRHRGFIPWDDDVDIGMTRRDIESFRQAVKESEDIFLEEYVRVNRENGRLDYVHKVKLKNYDVTFWVDIFVYDYSDQEIDGYEKRLLDLKKDLCIESFRMIKDKNAINNPEGLWKKYFDIYNKEFETINDEGKNLLWSIDGLIYEPANRSSISSNDLFPLLELEFEDGKFLAPNGFEKYLTKLYGDIFRMPDDMFSHKHYYHIKDKEEIIDCIIKELKKESCNELF